MCGSATILERILSHHVKDAVVIRENKCPNDTNGDGDCALCAGYGCLYGRILYQVTGDGRVIEFMIRRMTLNFGGFNVKFETTLVSPDEDWSREYHQANLGEVYVSRFNLVHNVFSDKEQAVKYIVNTIF